MSIALRDGVSRLEITTKVTLAVLALASGVYTYLGVRDLLNGDTTVVFFAAVIYSVAVSIGIYAFWTFLMRFLPHVQDRRSRGLLFACMGARLADDHRHVGLAQRLGAGRRRRDPAAPRGLGAELHRRSRPRAQQCARGAEPAARHPDGVDALLQAGRIRARRPAHRHVRLRHRRAASDADVEPARQSRPGSRRLGRQGEGAVRAGRQASREDARARLRSRPDQCAQRRLRQGGDGPDGRDRQVAADLRCAVGQARRGRARLRLHRAGGGRPRRSRRPADQRGRPGRAGGRRAGQGAVGRRQQDPRYRRR